MIEGYIRTHNLRLQIDGYNSTRIMIFKGMVSKGKYFWKVKGHQYSISRKKSLIVQVCTEKKIFYP